MDKVRPVARVPAEEMSVTREHRVWSYPEGIFAEMNFFGDWYGVWLTGDSAQADQWIREKNVGERKMWMLGDRIERVDPDA
jgi:hypothetical protein